MPASPAAAETGMSHQAKVISIILLVLVLSAATAYGVRRFFSSPKQNEKPSA
jgi:flagellar basal body-associated protein FliL